MSSIDYHSKALLFASHHLDSWKTTTKSTSSIQLLTGNSNKVFLLTSSLPIIPDKLIYRVFGPDQITEKERERKIFSQLSEYNFGPKNLGSSSTERLEEFFEGFIPVPNSMFHDRRVVSKVSKIFRKVHDLNMSKVIGNEGIVTEANLLKWRNLIKEKLNFYEEIGKLEEIREVISQEVLDIFYSILPRESEVVYCHLDPSPINILYHPEKNKFKLIDYEFSGYSYRSIDLALMLNECKIDFLYDKYPFFRICEEMEPTDSVIKEYVLAYGEGKKLWVEIKKSLILADLIWSFCSFAIYSGPCDGVDFLNYGLARFGMFKKGYSEYVENGKDEFLEKLADEIFEGAEPGDYLVHEN